MIVPYIWNRELCPIVPSLFIPRLAGWPPAAKSVEIAGTFFFFVRYSQKGERGSKRGEIACR